MFRSKVNIVLVEPEIPSNTGNIIRLCANTGSSLHMIGPMGFSLDNSKMKRAGLDYHELCSFNYHKNWSNFWEKANPKPENSYGLTTKTNKSFFDSKIYENVWFFFGSETRGLSLDQKKHLGEKNLLKIPMVKGSRSINLSNSVAVVIYDSLRRIGLPSLTN
jgi:tRNA (cytidine/uridine-2'-O-)-methyltransferase